MDDSQTDWSSGDSTEAQVIELTGAGGAVVAFSSQSPEKTTGNEDTVGIFSYGPAAIVLAVADGAGGLPAGQKASRTAIATIGKSLQASAEQTQLLRSAVLNGIEAANRYIMDHSNGSATTLTVVTVEGRSMRSFHVGDSMAAVVGQRGALKFATVAHSPVGFAVEAGFLSEQEAMHHIDRNVVSNFLGMTDMRIDVSAEVELAPRDTIVVASDGLSDNLHMPEIVDRIRVGRLPAAMRKLVELSAYRMANPGTAQPSKPDDLSIVLFRRIPASRRR